MNVRFSLVVGAALACAVITGCKAPKAGASSGGSAEPARCRCAPGTVHEFPCGCGAVDCRCKVAPKTEAAPRPITVTEVKKPEAPRCKCAPGTVHESPCKCGAPDCRCKVAPPPEPEYTLYRVKGGDTLSAICVQYGLKQKKVLDLNPGLSPNKLYAGRKIRLPGKVELKGDDAKSADAKPVAAKPAGKARSARASSYAGATKVYVVKGGDTLGKIAIDGGVTVKCLMDMNGLKSRVIRVGQKLKVPAEKAVAEKKPAEKKVAAEKKPADEKPAAKPVAEPPADAKPAAEPPADVKPAAEPPADAKPAVEPPAVPATADAESESAPKTHTVKEGEDVVSIAIAYGVSPSSIFDLNNIKGTDAVEPGTVLKLPASAKAQ